VDVRSGLYAEIAKGPVRRYVLLCGQDE